MCGGNTGSLLKFFKNWREGAGLLQGLKCRFGALVWPQGTGGFMKQIITS